MKAKEHMFPTESFERDLREMNRLEAEQAHRRISWLGSLQGFLFAALGLVWGKNGHLQTVVELIGLTVAVLVVIGTVTGVLAQLRLHKLWIGCVDRNKSAIGPFGLFPERAIFTTFISPEVLIPTVFVLAWLAIILWC
jgi:hypothetical protein